MEVLEFYGDYHDSTTGELMVDQMITVVDRSYVARVAAKREVAKTITSYMDNKTREGGFRDTVSLLLYDYIDRGNAFAMPSFETRYKKTETEMVTDFIGPKAVRIRPEDIVFNPTVADFENSPKIVRSLVTLGQLKKMSDTHPDYAFWKDVLDRRKAISSAAQTYSSDDWEKAQMYNIDGFGTYKSTISQTQWKF